VVITEVIEKSRLMHSARRTAPTQITHSGVPPEILG
jgi:hypothetical protein